MQRLSIAWEETVVVHISVLMVTTDLSVPAGMDTPQTPTPGVLVCKTFDKILLIVPNVTS